MSSISQQMVPKIHPEGHKFIAIFIAITAVFFWLWEPLGWVGVILSLWCAWFFRDPVRVTCQNPGLVIAPADGVILLIEPAAPPPELGYDSTPLTRISIFMSVFDVHVNRSPMAGTVERVVYQSGKFLNAALDKASVENERSTMLLKLDNLVQDGQNGQNNQQGNAENEMVLTKPKYLIVVQIAGLVARRILSFVKQGDTLKPGERYGLIRFGSRVDVYLPNGVTPLVSEGQRAIAGETILADILASPQKLANGQIYRRD